MAGSQRHHSSGGRNLSRPAWVVVLTLAFVALGSCKEAPNIKVILTQSGPLGEVITCVADVPERRVANPYLKFTLPSHVNWKKLYRNSHGFIDTIRKETSGWQIGGPSLKRVHKYSQAVLVLNTTQASGIDVLCEFQSGPANVLGSSSITPYFEDSSAQKKEQTLEIKMTNPIDNNDKNIDISCELKSNVNVSSEAIQFTWEIPTKERLDYFPAKQSAELKYDEQSKTFTAMSKIVVSPPDHLHGITITCIASAEKMPTKYARVTPVVKCMGPIMSIPPSPNVPGIHRIECKEAACPTAAKTDKSIYALVDLKATGHIFDKGSTQAAGMEKSAWADFHAYARHVQMHPTKMKCSPSGVSKEFVIMDYPSIPTIFGPHEVKQGSTEMYFCVWNAVGGIPKRMRMYLSSDGPRKAGITSLEPTYDSNSYRKALNIYGTFNVTGKTKGEYTLLCAVDFANRSVEVTRVQGKTIAVKASPSIITESRVLHIGEKSTFQCHGAMFNLNPDSVKEIVFGSYDLKSATSTKLYSHKGESAEAKNITAEFPFCTSAGIFTCTVKYMIGGEKHYRSRHSAVEIKLRRNTTRKLSMTREPLYFGLIATNSFALHFICDSTAPSHTETVFLVRMCESQNWIKWNGSVEERMTKPRPTEHSWCHNEVNTHTKMTLNRLVETDICGVRCEVRRRDDGTTVLHRDDKLRIREREGETMSSLDDDLSIVYLRKNKVWKVIGPYTVGFIMIFGVTIIIGIRLRNRPDDD